MRAEMKMAGKRTLLLFSLLRNSTCSSLLKETGNSSVMNADKLANKFVLWCKYASVTVDANTVITM